jgi:cation-transporting ATPase 13A1
MLDLVCKDPQDTVTVVVPESELKHAGPTKRDLANTLESYDLCVSGRALKKLEGTPFFTGYLLPKVFVYARVSPSQKEYILLALKAAGYTTLMCGDGTNDVGALKHAHVGIAMLNSTPEDLEKITQRMRQRRMAELKKRQEEMMKQWGVQLPEEQRQQGQKSALAKKQAEAMSEMMETMDDMPVLKFGDASVAAPFVSKLNTVSSSTLTELI